MRERWDFPSLGCADRIACITYPGPPYTIIKLEQFYGSRSSSTSWCGSRNNLKHRVYFGSYVYSTLTYFITYYERTASCCFCSTRTRTVSVHSVMTCLSGNHCPTPSVSSPVNGLNVPSADPPKHPIIFYWVCRHHVGHSLTPLGVLLTDRTRSSSDGREPPSHL